MKKLFVILFVVSLSCGLASTSMAVIVDYFGGHTYELVLVPGGSSWANARAAALAEDPAGTWDLVSINSQAEQNWLVGTLIPQAGFTDADGKDHLWIGGQYISGAWQWVDGSPIVNYGWTSGEPPVPPGTRIFLQMWSDQNWLWDAVTSTDGMTEGRQVGFIKETPVVPEPGTMMLLGSGLVGLAGWGRKKFRK